jgi:hypothetical protein
VAYAGEWGAGQRAAGGTGVDIWGNWGRRFKSSAVHNYICTHPVLVLLISAVTALHTALLLPLHDGSFGRLCLDWNTSRTILCFWTNSRHSIGSPGASHSDEFHLLPRALICCILLVSHLLLHIRASKVARRLTLIPQFLSFVSSKKTDPVSPVSDVSHGSSLQGTCTAARQDPGYAGRQSVKRSRPTTEHRV